MSAALRLASRRLATAGAVHRAQGGTPAIFVDPVRGAATTLKSRSRCFSGSSAGIMSMAKESGEKFYKAFIRSSGFMASVTAYAGVISGTGYWVVQTLEKGVDDKLVVQNNTLDAKLESEKLKREGFQSIATHAHQETVRRIDQSFADLYLEFNKLFRRWLEGQEENFKRVHDMEDKIDHLTRELDAMKKVLLVKEEVAKDGRK